MILLRKKDAFVAENVNYFPWEMPLWAPMPQMRWLHAMCLCACLGDCLPYNYKNPGCTAGRVWWNGSVCHMNESREVARAAGDGRCGAEPGEGGMGHWCGGVLRVPVVCVCRWIHTWSLLNTRVSFPLLAVYPSLCFWSKQFRVLFDIWWRCFGDQRSPPLLSIKNLLGGGLWDSLLTVLSSVSC